MKTKILGALLRKEFKIIRSNPLMPKVILVMPIMVMLVLPLVADLDVHNVGVAVVDQDRSQLSRRIISDLGAPDELNVVAVCSTHDEGLGLLEHGEADVLLGIPADFERDLRPVDIEANGVNATKGMLGAQYVSQSVVGTLSQWRELSGSAVPAPTLSVLNRYNPTLDFRNFMVPALIVVMLIIICGFLPTLNLMSEVESGTIEAMNVTPVGRFTFILSKLLPFWLVALPVISEGMLIGWLVYGLAPVGNIGAIFLASILFSLVMSGMSVAVANKSATILQSIFVMMAVIIIFQLMGGLFTPIGSMPEWAQWLTYAVPPRYFNEIMRAVYLKGATVAELWPQFVSLGVFAAFFCVLAALTYRKQN